MVKQFFRIFIFLLFTLIDSVFAQTLSLRRYTVNDGLVQNQVVYIFQDNKGYLWLATRGGISRFDGLEFKNITLQNGLPVAMINSILEDKKGNLYFISHEYISKLEGNELINTKIKLKKSISIGNGSVLDDNNRIILLGKENNQPVCKIIYDKGKVSYQYINIEPFDKQDYIIEIQDRSTGTFWFYNDQKGLYYLPQNEENLRPLKMPFRRILSYTPTSIKEFFVVGEDYILYSVSGFRFKKIMSVKRYAPNISDYTFYYNAIKKGALVKNHLDNVIRLLVKEDMEIKDSLSIEEGMSGYYTDREGNSWILSEVGLIKIQSAAFLNFTKENGVIPYVWSVLEDSKGKIWFFSYKALIQSWDENKLSKKSFLSTLKSDRQKIKGFYMGSIKDQYGNIWLATEAPYGLMKWNRKENTPVIIKSLDPSNTTLFIYNDSQKNRLLLGSTMGLYVLSDYKNVKLYPVTPGDRSNKIVSIAKDKRGIYWLGGFNGITLWDGSETFIHLPNKNIPFLHGANAMVLDKTGNLWIGNGNGLYLYDYKKIRKINYPYNDGLITALTIDFKNNLLIGSLKGISLLNIDDFYKNNYRFYHFDKENGFQGIECAQNGIIVDRKGRFWIPTSDRVVRFDPSLFHINKEPPLISVSIVEKPNERMAWSSIAEVKSLDTIYTFNSNAKNLRFNFHAISFSNPEKIKYSYKLIGFDSKWSIPNNERFATYTNLAPGKYTFMVKAISDNGICSLKPAQFTFELEANFWELMWVRIVIVIILLAFSFIVAYYILHKQKSFNDRKLEYELKINDLQLKSIRNQIDPHFTFNAINSIGASILKHKPDEAYIYLQKFSRLIRALLESSDKIDRTLEDEIEFVSNYLELEQYRHNEKFTYAVNIHEDVDLLIKVPKMIIQTFAENAVRHGFMHLKGKGRLIIELSVEKNNLLIVIEDNGIGRIKAEKLGTRSTGKGIRNIDEFSHLFCQKTKQKIQFEITDLYDSTGKAAGTKVEILMAMQT